MLRAAATLALAVGTAAAADPVWIKASTPNFELFTNYGDKQAIEIIRHFEQIREFFAATTQSKKAAQSRVRLVAFRSAKDFAPYSPNEFAAAYYLSAGDRDYVVMKEARQDVYRIAVHEYVHLVIKHSGFPVPPWLNEGLAELYSTMREQSGKTVVGDLIPGHVHQLRNAKWIDLDTLLAVDRESPLYNEKDRAGVFYAQSWALTHMLNLDADYRAKFGEYLAGSTGGLDKVYGKPSKKITDDLRAYINGTRFMAALFDQKLEKSRVTPSIEASDEVERGMLFATLLQYRKPAESLGQLKALAASYPDRAEPHESLAYLLWRQGDVTSAIEHMRAAAKAGSTNAKLHYDCAMLGQMKGYPDEETVKLLEKATDLQPDFKDAYLRLGSVEMQLKHYAKAVVALQQIKRIDAKDAVWYFRTLAYANHQILRKDEAVKNAELYAKHATQPRDVADAERLLKWVKGEREFVLADGRQAMPHAAPQGEVIERIVPAGPDLKLAEGALTEVVCAAGRATVRIETPAKKLLAFLIDDPGLIVIRGTGDMHFEFTCGKQMRTTVGVKYEERGGMPAGISGLVRELVFGSK